MGGGAVLFFSPEVARRFEPDLAAVGGRAVVQAGLTLLPPPDERAWARAVSELALFNWLLLPTEAAAEAVLAGSGATPSSTLRVAAVAPAGEALREAGRVPDLEAHGLRALCDRLDGQVGRRQRILVPHFASAGRSIGNWLLRLGAEPVCVAAYGLEVEPPDEADRARVAVLDRPIDAEALAAGEARRGLIVAALTVGAADAAEDCGLTAVYLPAERLGPFLGEALS